MNGARVSAADPAELAADLIAAINSRDVDTLGGLLDECSEVVTGRSTHVGPEAIVAWAFKEYDHLLRRYAIDEVRLGDRAVLALGSVQYVWSEDEQVADSSPIALELAFSNGRLRRLHVHDDAAAALAALDP